MHIGKIRFAFAPALAFCAVVASPAWAQSTGLDLGSIKPKSADAATTPSTTSTIGVSPLRKPTDTATTGKDAVAPGGIGTTIKNPLATKGVVGPGGATKSPTPEESANSTDVVVKMPSNMKK